LNKFANEVRKPKQEHSCHYGTLSGWKESHYKESHSILAHHVHKAKHKKYDRTNILECKNAKNNGGEQRRSKGDGRIYYKP
jgi:hypothetical protein